ncbi:MAG: 3-oxoacyl-[acyl-carrier protein] reductase [Betaproteobacteria bacterium]|jgi:3-oxoacyl-[acyl-carrier protein] reductase|nr:3-oxoacyl-[acyl-carrier protein] reductase [Betaproteobacteria bacterium]
MPLEGLRGKKALVTGAASGIGDAVRKRLEREGVQVFATDIHQTGDLIVADLTDADQIEKLAAKVGTPDFVINVAGGPVAPSRSNTLPAMPSQSLVLEDIDPLQFAAVIAANLTSAFLVCKEFAPRMKARKSGRIVNFASIAARRGSDRVGVHYAAAKGGVIALTKTLALELGPFGIAVNAIAPGFIATPRIEQSAWGRSSPEAHRAFLDAIPLGRAGKPDDIAGVVAMLCSEAGGYVSGATIDVNGGLYFGP